MAATPTPFDSEAPLGARRAIIRCNPDNPQEMEMIEAVWGSNPRFSDGVAFRFVRSEGKTFPSRRCLIPASEFQLAVGKRRYRVTLDGGNFFYLAGVWEPAMGDWPLYYRIVTVEANPEVALHQERHGAIIHRRQVKQWLGHEVPETDLLMTPPARTFVVEEIDAKPVQTALAF
ncbi:SOS response-associated peptidase family protein [Sphingomonas sp. S2-65]|uniref:SOS response-associated peptidase family protein n=1 Tax=Sphingomonas sp. S2-65 TaxID=2903960 RepID=UPI001F1C4A78|nr:SOS response-associated peptidase family protein [Sphingomonas sp. S2-65]UYY57192.1 SOS response-associated peptidase family protein [Sphingomonas sp. S2-65]